MTTPEVAAHELGKDREQLFAGLPDSVYLVVMHGDLSRPGTRDERGPYLAFLCWRSGDSWNTTDFTLLQRAVPLEYFGKPQSIKPFAVTHPTLDHAWRTTATWLFWFLPPVLLLVSAALCAWKRRSRWSYVLASCVAIAVAGWQVYYLRWSMVGREWNPVFHGIKLGVLALVFGVELAAAFLLLRTRSRLRADGEARTDEPARLNAGVVLLVVAALLYDITLLALGTTGQ